MSGQFPPRFSHRIADFGVVARSREPKARTEHIHHRDKLASSIKDRGGHGGDALDPFVWCPLVMPLADSL
jgi:hypothetical protein